MIMAIDPGNTESAFVWMDEEDMRPIRTFKLLNGDVIDEIGHFSTHFEGGTVVIERISSYGMAVGRDVFETAEWYGKFLREAERERLKTDFLYRRDVKITICGTPAAKDSNIKRALIDRFAEHDLKNGKGTKKNPDWFYGFAADIWQAYALGVAWIDRMEKYADKIIDATIYGTCQKTRKIAGIICCETKGDCKECERKYAAWLEAEYVEPSIDWRKVKVDTPSLDGKQRLNNG